MNYSYLSHIQYWWNIIKLLGLQELAMSHIPVKY